MVGARQFERARTNIKTFDRPDKLVTWGVFRWTRNPMYLGFAGALFGLWLALGSASPALIMLAFWVTCDRWYIRFEERVMRQRFGADYLAYCERTRRWL